MTRRRGLLAALVVLGGVAVALAPPAQAACHAFTISASPATVTEGGTVTVTVQRDAAAAPSSVKVTSVNASAVAGQDYPAVDRTVSMSGTDTKQTFTVTTINDTTPEGTEMFSLHLSNGAGCAINPNFTYGSDAAVQIQDNDAVATTAPPAAPATIRATTTRPGPTSTTVAAETTTTLAGETTTELSSTTTAAELAQDASDSGGGGTAVLVVLVVLVALAAGALGYFLYRRRAA